MNIQDKFEFIDEFLAYLEDTLKGKEGDDCSKARRYLSDIQKRFCCDDSKKVHLTVNGEQYYIDYDEWLFNRYAEETWHNSKNRPTFEEWKKQKGK